MKQRARVRKTRKEKILAEKRKIERELAKLDELEKRLKEEQEKLFKKEDRLLTAEAILKVTSMVSLAFAGVTIFITGIGHAKNIVEKENNTEQAIYEYMDSAEYEGIKATHIDRYYQDYTNGKISTNEFADKVVELDSFDYVKENHINNIREELDVIEAEYKRVQNNTLTPLSIVGGAAFVVSVVPAIGGVIAGKKRKQAEKEYEAATVKELKLSNKITKKKEELRELE